LVARQQAGIPGMNTLSIDLYSRNTLIQKLQYIHCSPMQRWGLVQWPEKYKYSPAKEKGSLSSRIPLFMPPLLSSFR